MSKLLNDDPFKPWNSLGYRDSPLAPHNGIDRDNPFKPWNSPFGKSRDLTDKERRAYNLPERVKK